MRRIVVWVAKGGPGKSTVATNLGAALAASGSPTLVIDLDSQASGTRMLGGDPRPGLLAAIRGDAELVDLVQPTPIEGLDLVPADAELSRAERLLASEPGAERLLAMALDRLPRKRWQTILFDSPPGISVLVVGALVASTDHIAPLEPAPSALAGLVDALDLVDTVRRRLAPKLAQTKILLSRVPSTRAARMTVEGIRERFGRRVYRTAIPSRAVLVEASAARRPLEAFRRTDPVAQLFRDLAQEIQK